MPPPTAVLPDHPGTAADPRAARPWVVAVLALLAAGGGMPSPLYPGYQQLFGFSDLVLTVVYAAYPLVAVPALLLLGPVGDRLPPRRVLRGGVAVAAVGSLCLALAPSTPWLIIGRAAFGLALGAVTGVGMAVLARSAKRLASTGAGAAAFLLGSAAGPALTGVLAEIGPAPRVLPFVVHLALLAVVFVGLGRLREPGRRQAPDPQTGALVLSTPLRRALAVAAVNGLLGWGVVGLFLGLLPSLVARSLGLPGPALAGGLVGAVVAWSAVAAPAVRRLGPRRAQLVGLAAMTVPLTVLALGATSLTAVLLACTVAGLAHGLLYGGAAGTVNTLTPAGRASGITATVWVAFYLGDGLATLVVGLFTTIVPLTAAVSTAAVAALVVVLTMIRPTSRALRTALAEPGPRDR